MSARSRPAVLSLVASGALLAVKLGAYWVTDSTAVLSDALESIVNVAAAAFALFSVELAQKPPDANHPYGHGKVEFLSAAFEGGLVFFAGGSILFNAVRDLVAGPTLRHLDLGLWLVGGAAAANLLLGVYLVDAGKRLHSLALVADGKHVLTDVWTSVMVLVGLALVLITGKTWIDPVVAVIAAANLLRIGWQLVRASVAGIMDEADPADLEAIAGALRALREPRLAGWANVRSRHQGALHHVDLTVYVTDATSVPDARSVASKVEEAIREALGQAEVLCRIEPDPAARQPATE